MQVGDRVAHRYDVVRPLGAGGMGEVFLARDLTLERDVALRVLPAALSQDPISRERFRREALAAAWARPPTCHRSRWRETPSITAPICSPLAYSSLKPSRACIPSYA